MLPLINEELISKLAEDCDKPTGDEILDNLFNTYNESSPRDDSALYYRFLYKLGQHCRGYNTSFVELGCKYGAGSIHFLKGGGGAALAIDVSDTIKRELCENLNIIFKMCSSVSKEATSSITKADIVFIDTDHSYELTQREFEVWYPKVNKGGLILFDDICAPEYGCTRFWKQLPGRKVELAHLHPKQWGFGVYFV